MPSWCCAALREGADEYVADEDVETDLESTLLQLKTKRSPKNENGRVVAVLAPSGGSGASTLSANLAVALAKPHGSVALAEIPHGQGDQQLLLDLQPVHTLADLCRHLHRLDRSMFEQSLAVHSTGVRLLAATGGSSSAAAITPQGIRQALALSRSMFPFVVVDVDRVLARQQVAALVQADVILLVLRLDLMSLNSTRWMLNQLDQLGIADSAINVVVNRFRQPKELSYRKVEQALGLKLFHFVINDPAALNLGTSKGVPTVVDCPRSKYSKSVFALAQRVDEFCRNQRPNSNRPQEPVTADPTTNGKSRRLGTGMLLPPLTAAAVIPVVEEDCSN